MFSVFFIFSPRNVVLALEKYRDDISEELLNSMYMFVLKTKPDIIPPCIKQDGIFGYSIRREKIIYLLISKKEISSLVSLQFLTRFHSLLHNFCGGATEDYIRQNITLVHELMTECLDNGFMKTTSAKVLRPVIYTDPICIKSNYGQKSEIKKPGPFGLEKVFISNSAAERPLVKSRSQQSLRQEEVFADVVEKLVVHFDKEGLVERFFLHGTIHIKSFIKINHSIIVTLEEYFSEDGSKKAFPTDISFDDCYFGKGVDSKEFKNNHSFISHPSQEEIKVMTYHIESAVPVYLPFRMVSAIQIYPHNRDCDLTLKLMCNLSENVEVINISLHVPVPSATRNVMQQFSAFENTAEFLSKERKILWKIKKLPGHSEVIAKFKLIDAMQCSANKLEIGPVALEFEASNTTCSGLKIKNIKAQDPSGKPISIQRWVRYITLPNSYVFRI